MRIFRKRRNAGNAIAAVLLLAGNINGKHGGVLGSFVTHTHHGLNPRQHIHTVTSSESLEQRLRIGNRPTDSHHRSCHSKAFMIATKDKKGAIEIDSVVVDQNTSALSKVNGEMHDSKAVDDISQLMDEINARVANGTASLLRDLSLDLDEKLTSLPENAAMEMMTYLGDLSEQMMIAQESALERNLAELDRRFWGPLEDIAFSDVPLLEPKTGSWIAKSDDDDADEKRRRALVLDRDNLILMGANSTLGRTRRMRTKEMLRNFNVAPLYYSMALLVRWAGKASYPSIYAISLYRNLASVIKSNSKGKSAKADQISGETLSAGWKRTGEIAAKGPIAKRWAILRRSAEIWAYFSSFYLKDRRINAKFNSGQWSEERLKEERSKLGAEITQNLLKLGPTFIKVGQLFSTRLDIVPKEYIDQLKELQDNVPGFSGETAVRIIESELGKPIDQIFDSFNRTALAAASLGQVHVARKGKVLMAVKIQRQYLRELFDVDLGQLRQVAIFADALDLQAEGGILDRNTQRDWVSVFEENKRLLYEEIDYLNELKNAQRFKKNFDNVKFRHIRVPNVYPECTTDKVLTMEYVPGIKITNKEAIVKAGIDPVEISVKMAEAFLEQLCRHGFVSDATSCVMPISYLVLLTPDIFSGRFYFVLLSVPFRSSPRKCCCGERTEW
jgi:ABC1 atypical kinase-like domain